MISPSKLLKIIKEAVFPSKVYESPEVKEKRSSKKYEKLTDWERDWMMKHEFRCPDCCGRLMEGPEGGVSMNMACSICGSEFCITYFQGFCIGERISDKGPRFLGERAQFYR